MNILQINSSVRGDASASTRLANSIVANLKTLTPTATLTVRETGQQPILDDAALGALFTPAEQRTPEQAARVAIDDATIAEVQAADVIVIGVPMYNFGVPVQLKAWIDAIAKAGVTFRYTANGPEGLLKDKKVYLALARGGLYKDTPADVQTPYLKNVFGFLGLTDLTFIHAEGLSMGEESAAQAFAQAEAEIAAIGA
ncbi:FMN-dependent NADH-azoreductase [Rhodobacteraceae bacterium CH30]|nr:FMN-dependent NADH-azoreductase [Rhodobacteraceae bacterium CH30]